MDSSDVRRSKLKEVLGTLLALPTFVANTAVMNGSNPSDVSRRVISSTFLVCMNKSIKVTAKKGSLRSILESLKAFANTGATVHTIERYCSEKDETECDAAPLESFRGIEKKLIALVIQDLSHIFQVHIADESRLNGICAEGCTLLRQLHVANGGKTLSSLFSCGFVGSVVCACLSSLKLRKSDTGDERSRMLRLIEVILCSWLSRLDSSVEVAMHPGSRFSHPKNWIAYILSCKTAFGMMMMGVKEPVIVEDVETRPRTDVATSSQHSNDANMMISNVIPSLIATCAGLLQSRSTFTTLSGDEIIREQFIDVSTNMRRSRAPNEDGRDNDTFGNHLDAFQSFVRKSFFLTRDWPMSFNRYEQSGGTGNEAMAMYSVSVHTAVCICSALLFHTDAITAVYGEIIEEALAEAFEVQIIH